MDFFVVFIIIIGINLIVPYTIFNEFKHTKLGIISVGYYLAMLLGCWFSWTFLNFNLGGPIAGFVAIGFISIIPVKIALGLYDRNEITPAEMKTYITWITICYGLIPIEFACFSPFPSLVIELFGHKIGNNMLISAFFLPYTVITAIILQIVYRLIVEYRIR